MPQKCCFFHSPRPHTFEYWFRGQMMQSVAPEAE